MFLLSIWKYYKSTNKIQREYDSHKEKNENINNFNIEEFITKKNTFNKNIFSENIIELLSQLKKEEIWDIIFIKQYLIFKKQIRENEDIKVQIDYYNVKKIMDNILK